MLMARLKEYVALSHTGPFLQINEDTVDVDLVNNLFLLLDGFGGSGIGDLAVEKLKQDIKSFYSKSGQDEDATLPFAFSHKYLVEGNILINSIYYAHERIKQENGGRAMAERAGAGGIVGAMAENIMTFACTGNGVAYLYRKGRLSMVCRPDNLEGVAGASSERHFCTSPASGFGLFDQIYFEVSEVRLWEDDLFMIFSDGIYSRIQEGELEEMLEKESSGHGKTVEALMELANSRGNMDNQSAIFLQF